MMTYIYAALLCYGITFIGGFFLSFVVTKDPDWKEHVVYGAANSVVFGSALYLTVILIEALNV